MDKLGDSSAFMTDACDRALFQIEYFVSRNYKLDPPLYRACKADAVHFCHAGDAWASDGIQMDPERGPLILPCLYRYAYHPQQNMTVRAILFKLRLKLEKRKFVVNFCCIFCS